MKKIISLVLIVALILGMFVLPVSANTDTVADGYYLNAGFDDDVNPFEITSGGGSVSIVDAATEGVGESGKVLKFSSGTSRTITYADATFTEAIAIDNPIVFEARFRAPGEEYRYLFRMTDFSTSGTNGDGLISLIRPTGAYDLSPTNDGTNFLEDSSGNPILINVSDWYKIKAIYDGSNDGTIASLELYDDNDNLLGSASNLSTASSQITQINTIGFWMRDYGTENIIYLDDVKIYEYIALSVGSSFNNVLSTDTLEIEIPFNKELDENTISGVSITSENAASPEIVLREVTGSTLKLTLREGLAPSATYTIDLSGLKAADGSELLSTTLIISTPTELGEGVYLDARFDDGITPFSVTSGGGNVEIVDAVTAGAESGKVLKFSSGTSRTFTYVDASFAEAIALDKPLVFEAQFRAPGESYQYLFRMTDSSTNGTNGDGLISLIRPTGAYDLSPTNNGTDFLVDSGGNPILIDTSRWYTIKLIYDGQTSGTIASLELYDDGGNLLGSASNLTTSSSDIKQISTVGFWQRDYGSEDIIYLDNIKIYEYDALSVGSSFNGVLPIDTLEIEIPFNKELDTNTLSGVSIIGIDAASPVIVSRTADGSTLKLTLQDMLIGSASYTIDLSGLKATDGSELLFSTLSAVTPLEEVEGVYLNARFDDNENPFEITGGAGSMTLVDAATVGAGTSGKVLKFSSGTSRTITYADATFDYAIPIDKPVVFETRFRAPGESHQHLFRLTDSSTNRHKYNGLVRLVRPTGAYDLSVNPSSDDANDAASCLKDADGNPILIDTGKWYRVRAIYDGATNGGTITTLELYDSDDNLISSATNLPTQNAAYPITQISTAGFWQRDYGSEDVIYFDDVKVYEYKESDPLTLLGSSIDEGAEVSPVETESITLTFNNRIDINSLNGFVVKADNNEVNYSAVLVGDSKKVEITFTDGLIGAANYSVDYSGVQDLNGTSASGIFTFKTRAGLFVKDIIYLSDNLAPGATVTGRVNMLNYTGNSAKITVIAIVYEQIGDARKMRNATALIDEPVTEEIDYIDISVDVPYDVNAENASGAIIVLENMNTLQLVADSYTGYD